MADAKLTPRQLVDVLHRLDAIESHSRHVRQQLIEAMADRRRLGAPAARSPGNGETVSRKRPRKTRGS
jgi:hypothetical protein